MPVAEMYGIQGQTPMEFNDLRADYTLNAMYTAQGVLCMSD